MPCRGVGFGHRPRSASFKARTRGPMLYEERKSLDVEAHREGRGKENQTKRLEFRRIKQREVEALRLRNVVDGGERGWVGCAFALMPYLVSFFLLCSIS